MQNRETRKIVNKRKYFRNRSLENRTTVVSIEKSGLSLEFGMGMSAVKPVINVTSKIDPQIHTHLCKMYYVSHC